MNFEIREGNISRDNAIKYAEKYDGKCDNKFIDNFCNYIEISKSQFNKVILKNVNKKIFSSYIKKNKLIIRKKFIVGTGLFNAKNRYN